MFWGFFGLDSKLDLLLKGQKAMAATLDDIKAKVDALNASLDAIAALVVSLKASAADPVKVQAIADELDAELTKAGGIK